MSAKAPKSARPNLKNSHRQGGGEIEVRNFSQFSAISQFFAIFRNFSQFFAIFRNFSAIFLTSRFSDCLPTLVQNSEKNIFLLCLHVCMFAFSHSVGQFQSGSTNWMTTSAAFGSCCNSTVISRGASCNCTVHGLFVSVKF